MASLHEELSEKVNVADKEENLDSKSTIFVRLYYSKASYNIYCFEMFTCYLYRAFSKMINEVRFEQFLHCELRLYNTHARIM